MLGEIFYWVFNMSLVASFMGIVVLLLRKIRKLPRRYAVFLWIIPFLRMCVPLGLNNPYSLLSLVSKFTTRTVTVYNEQSFSLSITNALMAANNYFPIKYRTSAFEKLFDITGILWLAGMTVCILVLGILYAVSMREIHDAHPLKDNVYVSSKADSPAVYGILHPKIVLPASGDLTQRYVLDHENAHIRRHDNLRRILGFLAASVHWFNPFSWIFLKCFLEDTELACDEEVIRHYDEKDRKGYASFLLERAAGKNLFASSFGGAKVRIRIEHILTYRKLTGVSAFCFMTLIAALIIAMITNAG